MEQETRSYVELLKEASRAEAALRCTRAMQAEIEADLAKAKATSDEFATVANAASVSSGAETYAKLAVEKAEHARQLVQELQASQAANADAMSAAKVKVAAAQADVAVRKQAKEKAEKLHAEAKMAHAQRAESAAKHEQAYNMSKVRPDVSRRRRCMRIHVSSRLQMREIREATWAFDAKGAL